MQEPYLKLQEAGLNDLETISRLASEIWNAHYIPIIGKQQVDYMLERMYSKENLSEQLLTKKHTFYLILVNATVSGFISVNQEKAGEWFLNKFYILAGESAKGLGTKALEALRDLVGAKKITLTVNRKNFKSINFYFKNNFRILQVADFDIGEGYVMNDFVMVWEAAHTNKQNKAPEKIG